MREASKEELLERIESLEKECELWMRGFGKEQNKVEALQGEVERLQSMTHIMAGYISATDGRWQDKHPEECLKHFEELTEDTRRRQQQAERQEGEG